MKKAEKGTAENRSEPRTRVDQYRSVEFSINKTDPICQFGVRDVSPSGMGILLNSNSKTLKYLEVGQMLDMTYHPEAEGGPPVRMKTEIRHITYLEGGRYKGQYLVGLLIKSESTTDSQKKN